MRFPVLSCVAMLWGVTRVASGQLTAVDVQRVINQAVSRAVMISPNSVIAVTDREGYVLGVWNVAGGEPTDPQIATAVSKGGTAAFLSSNQDAFTSRTAGFIIQQHFPPGVRNASPGPLVGVGLSNLFFSDINKFKGPGSIPLFSPTPGLAVTAVPFTSLDGTPGGVPLYKDGQLVGGLGVTGDGAPPPIAGFRDENPITFIAASDKDEDVALAGQHGFGPSLSITADNVYINGIALPYVGSSTVHSVGGVVRGNASSRYKVVASPPPFPYPVTTFGGVEGQIRQPLLNDPIAGTIDGQPRLTRAEVERIIGFAADRARTTRAGIRLPIGTPMEVFITVVNNPGQPGVAPTVLGTFRTGEATLFSWDVAVQKARTAVYYSSRDILGFGKNIAMSTRTVGFLAESHYPPGIDADRPGPFFGQQEMFTCLSLPDLEPISGCAPDSNLPNGITIFPGGFPLYRNGVLIGAIGVSGDGVDQDDIVGASGTHDFLAPDAIRADQFVYHDARLPYAKFPRDPSGANSGGERVAPPLSSARLVNISSRASTGFGDHTMIAGFIVVGSAPEPVLIRGLGPSLAALGVPNVLQDPTLSLHNGAAAAIAVNDDWMQAANAAQIPQAFRPSDPRESAIFTSLDPGSYTVIETGKTAATAVGLLEVYDFGSGASSQLANVSTRAFVGTAGDVLIGGFILSGRNGSSPVIVRALGPSLTAFGVADADTLQNPALELRDANGMLVAANDDWKQTQRAAIEATSIAPKDDLESAILALLPLGAYTAIIRDVNGGSGVGLFEAYNLGVPLGQ